MKLCKEQGIGHPARFPEKLAEFFILSGSTEGDVVLDPFSGSGTTAAVAQRLNRVWIGIDANAEIFSACYSAIEYEKNLHKEGDNFETGD
jgi:DNA modification methylase